MNCNSLHYKLKCLFKSPLNNFAIRNVIKNCKIYKYGQQITCKSIEFSRFDTCNTEQDSCRDSMPSNQITSLNGV